MRRILKRMAGQRRAFRAIFARYGSRPARKNQRRPTVLLVNLTDLDGNPITDHMWFNCTRRFRSLCGRQGSLRQGDVIEFEALVTRYTKRVYDVVDTGAWWLEVDYRLCRPAHLQKVEAPILVDWPVPELLSV